MKTPLLAAAILTASSIVPGQEEQSKFRVDTFHVSSVERKQESGEYGSIIHIRAVADSKTIHYVLTCDDMYPVKKDPIVCNHVEAGQDYKVRIWPTAVDFGDPNEPNTKRYRRLYDIESEVEK
jgi:hypothetical protein